jgi:membrane-bound metal-dependent hydrolase YbcI (DUF457 family)
MTAYEHAMVGINGALAAGLHRRHGWQIVVLAGVAAILPDWDSLTLLFGTNCFAAGHRLWGHNLLVAGLVAAVSSAVAYQTDAPTKIQQWLARRWTMFAVPGPTAELPRGGCELVLWIAVGILAAYSHLLMDVLCSANRDLPVWGVPLLWPFARGEWAYPLLSWGDPGATVIFAAGMFAMVFWRNWMRSIAWASLLAVAAYMALCGVLGG